MEKVDQSSPTSAKSNSYSSKKSWLKWLLIYALVAVVIYAAIYYLLLNKNSSPKFLPSKNSPTNNSASSSATYNPSATFSAKPPSDPYKNFKNK